MIPRYSRKEGGGGAGVHFVNYFRKYRIAFSKHLIASAAFCFCANTRDGVTWEGEMPQHILTSENWMAYLLSSIASLNCAGRNWLWRAPAPGPGVRVDGAAAGGWYGAAGAGTGAGG